MNGGYWATGYWAGRMWALAYWHEYLPFILARALWRRHRAEVFQDGTRRAHITP